MSYWKDLWVRPSRKASSAHEGIAVEATTLLLQTRTELELTRRNLRLADECKNSARQERDEALVQLALARDQRDHARQSYQLAFRVVCDLWDATGDGLEKLGPPAQLWPDVVINPSIERFTDHCGEQALMEDGE